MMNDEEKWKSRVTSLKSIVEEARKDFEYARSRLHSLTQTLVDEESAGPRDTTSATTSEKP